MSILTEILETKRQEVQQRAEQTPQTQLEREAASAPPVRGFENALRAAKPIALIAEVKKASPSKGVLRPDFDPLALASVYEQSGASALSVLTDEKYFQGKLEYLHLIREKVKLPLLRKDFILDEYQLFESRVAGADAVLLIVAALSFDRLKQLLKLARSLSLDVLVEAHSKEELLAALDAGATLIGVNNRDLNTFHTDLAITEQLAPLLPPNALLVSESGIDTRQQVERVQKAGAKAILIGESLVRSEDIPSKIKTLLEG